MVTRRAQESQLVRWKPENKDLVVHYIDALMSILTVQADGRVTTNQIFKLDVLTKILSENVIIEGISAPEVKQNLIQNAAFQRLKKYRLQNIFMFRRAVATEVRAYLSRPAERYWILLPLHVAPGQLGNARSITVLGTRLLFRDWDYVQRHFDLQVFLDESDLRLRREDIAIVSTCSPILVLSEGLDTGEAFDKARRAFDLFRWLINLGYQFGRTTEQWGGYPRPLAKILPPPTCGVFTEERRFEKIFYSVARYERFSRNVLRGDEIPEVRRLARRLTQPNNESETMTILIEAIEKYGQALDTFEWRTAFLLLWQILELVTLQNVETLNMKRVKSRVASLLGQDRLAKDLLSALYKTRNSLVHRGFFPDEEGLKEVNLLKYIVEMAIESLFSLLTVCPNTASLGRFYEHVTAGSSELADRQRVIRHILRQRSRS